MQARFPFPEQIHLDQEAMLYINHADVQVQSLDLKGALVIEGQQGVVITIDGLQVNNKGWEWRALRDSDDSEEHQKIRYICAVGFKAGATSASTVQEPGQTKLSSTS